MWLITTIFTLFILNVHVMMDAYSGTIVQRQSPAAQCHTAVTSHRTIRTSNFASLLTQQHCLLSWTVCGVGVTD
jgi:hypothetical protein